MDILCQSRINHDEDLVGYPDDHQGENIESQRPQNNSREDSGFVLNVNASCMQIGRQNDISFGSVDKTSDSKVNESDEASLSKTNTELCKRSAWVINQLQALRNDGKWEDFDKFSGDLLLKYPDTDTQITIKMEQSLAALYRNKVESALEFLDESFKFMPQAKNVELLAGRYYGYRAGIARRQKNLGEAATFMQLAQQNTTACHTHLDFISYIAYEKASVLLDFIGLAPQKSLQRVREALDNLERSIDLCMQLERDDHDLRIQRHHFAFVKIANGCRSRTHSYRGIFSKRPGLSKHTENQVLVRDS